jgi:hypothetical protein
MATIPYENDSTKFLLYAVNILLQSINELPIVNDTELAEIVEAQLAANVLEETKKEVLAEGWDINTDEDWNLMPNTEGVIAIPANILDLSDKQGRYFMRDWKLYDKKEKKFDFEEAVKCDITWDLDFNALTHPLRYYITIKASRTFQYRQVGDQLQYQFSEEDLNMAFLSAKRSEDFTGKYAFDNGQYGLNFSRRN